MGCGFFFYDRLDELGFQLKQYEKTLDLILREKLPKEEKNKYEIENQERKEQIRELFSDLNKFFEEKPKEKRFDRFKKLNEKFQYLLIEESNMHQDENKEEMNKNDNEENKREIRFFPN